MTSQLSRGYDRRTHTFQGHKDKINDTEGVIYALGEKAVCVKGEVGGRWGGGGGGSRSIGERG